MDPRPLQINGIIGGPAGRGVGLSIRVLKAQLIPVTQCPGYIRRVCVCFCLDYFTWFLHIQTETQLTTADGNFIREIRV